MMHSRKYGDRDSHPIYLWNGILEPKHLKKIGPALALFVWLIDRTTKEHDGVGAVLGGCPVKAEEIAESMGMAGRTVRREMDRLERHGYINRTRTPRGYTIRVMNSCKFPKRAGVIGQDCPITVGSDRTEMTSDRTKMTGRPDKNVLSNKSKQLSKQKEEAVVLPLAGFWQELGIDPKRLSGGIRKLCEDLYSAKGNQSPVDFLSVCMDGIQGMGWSIPRQLAQAKTELKANGHKREPLPELVAEPWGAGSGVRQ